MSKRKRGTQYTGEQIAVGILSTVLVIAVTIQILVKIIS